MNIDEPNILGLHNILLFQCMEWLMKNVQSISLSSIFSSVPN